MDELLALRWNNHSSTFLSILASLRIKNRHCDVTLTCDGKFYGAHKLVLSTCSDYFSSIFSYSGEKDNTIVVLKDVRSEDMESLLDYMYLGEVKVKQGRLPTLIKTAESLQVKGLAVPDSEEAIGKKRSIDSGKNDEKENDNIIKKKKISTSIPENDIEYNKDFSIDVENATTDTKFDCHLKSSTCESQNRDSDFCAMTVKEMSNSGHLEDISQINIKTENLTNYTSEMLTSHISDSSCNASIEFCTKSDSGNDSKDFENNSATNILSPNASNSLMLDLLASMQHCTSPSSNASYPSYDMGPVEANETSSGKYEYPCCYCGKNFLFMSKLREHLRTHTGERPFQCTLCPYRATRVWVLKRHIQTVHGKAFTSDILPSVNTRKTIVREITSETNTSFSTAAESHSLKDHSSSSDVNFIDDTRKLS